MDKNRVIEYIGNFLGIFRILLWAVFTLVGFVFIFTLVNRKKTELRLVKAMETKARN